MSLPIPSATEIREAEAVIAAAADGVSALNGKMIDRPVVERARRVIDQAGLDPPIMHDSTTDYA